MLTSLIALTLLAQEPQVNAGTIFTDPVTKRKTSEIIQVLDKLSPPKLAPKKDVEGQPGWSFDWVATGYGYVKSDPPVAPLRFTVFSQERTAENDRALMVTRMLLRLWEYNNNVLKMDHSQVFSNGVIQVYLCFGGKAGGEQLYDVDNQPLKINSPALAGKGVGEQIFDVDNQGGRPAKVNTIYLYDLGSFNGATEMAREVAHEYGHATLPFVGGYSQPEDWADGYLGEKLFLRHVEEQMEKGLLSSDDAMGATLPQMKTWVTNNVNPLVVRAAVNGPNPAALRLRTSKGMDEFLGLALYMDTILPESAFSRSLQVMGSTEAQDYPEAAVLAAEEPTGKYTLRIPTYLEGKAIWIPLGKCKVFGATVVRRNGSWALIRPAGHVTIVPALQDAG